MRMSNKAGAMFSSLCTVMLIYYSIYTRQYLIRICLRYLQCRPGGRWVPPPGSRQRRTETHPVQRSLYRLLYFVTASVVSVPSVPTVSRHFAPLESARITGPPVRWMVDGMYSAGSGMICLVIVATENVCVPAPRP